MGGWSTKGRALAIGLITGLAAAPGAAAQDATDLEFRQSYDDGLFDRDRDDDEPQEMREIGSMGPDVAAPPVQKFAFFSTTPVAASTDPSVAARNPEAVCTAGDYDGVPLNKYKTTGVVSATPTTNAADAMGGRGDVAFGGRAAISWTRQTHEGLCRHRDGQRPLFDPDWRFTTTLETRASDFADDNGGDSASGTLSFSFSHRLGSDATATHRYRTRFGASLANNVGYNGFYEDWGYTNHNFKLSVNHLFFETDAGSFGVTVAGGHSFSNPNKSSYSYGVIEVERIVEEIGGGWALTLGGSAAFRDYERAPTHEDWIYSASALLRRDLMKDVELGIGLTVTTRDSNDEARDYGAFSAPLSVTLIQNF